MSELQITRGPWVHSNYGPQPCHFCGVVTYHRFSRMGAFDDECYKSKHRTEIHVCDDCEADLQISIEAAHAGPTAATEGTGMVTYLVNRAAEWKDRLTARREKRAEYDAWVMSTHPTSRERTGKRDWERFAEVAVQVTAELIYCVNAMILAERIRILRAGGAQAHTMQKHWPPDAPKNSVPHYGDLVLDVLFVGTAIMEARVLCGVTRTAEECVNAFADCGNSVLAKVRWDGGEDAICRPAAREAIIRFIREHF